MGLCSGKLGAGPGDGDLLATTSWVREVVTSHQKKRKGDTLSIILMCLSFNSLCLGISKFCNFTFDPIGRSCNNQEEYHKVSVGFLNSKNQPQSVNWIVIFGTRSPQSPVSSEIEVRTTFIPDLHRFLASSSYKRAKFLFNIPELIYHEEKIVGQIHKQYLVLEDIQITKKCNPPPPYLVQVTIESSL